MTEGEAENGVGFLESLTSPPSHEQHAREFMAFLRDAGREDLFPEVRVNCELPEHEASKAAISQALSLERGGKLAEAADYYELADEIEQEMVEGTPVLVWIYGRKLSPMVEARERIDAYAEECLGSRDPRSGRVHEFPRPDFSFLPAGSPGGEVGRRPELVSTLLYLFKREQESSGD